MAQFKLNGESRTLEGETPLSVIVKSLHFSTPFYAVALNRTVIPRSEHEKIYVKEGDEVEVVHAVGGG